jgi:3-keto-5-aminohexanoate cleavage enzyme
VSEVERFIVNVCLTGMVPRKASVPSLPISPSEVAADVEACVERGASMFHIHARDEHEEPEWRSERYSEILSAARELSPDAVLGVTTSGRIVQDFERRSGSLDATPAPDMASLTLGPVNFLREGSANDPSMIRDLATAMRERGIVPELEVFDVGMAHFAGRLLQEEILKPPLYANVILGNVSSAASSPGDLAAVVQALPPGVVWCVGGIGRAQLGAATMGVVFGHGTRIGLEDAIRFPDGEPASNPALVERIVSIGRLLGKEPMSPGEVRALLGLRTGEHVVR